MEEALSRGRGALAVRGLLALAFGVLAISWPKLTLAILIVGFAAYAICDGIFTIAAAVRSSRREGRAWPIALEGLLSLAAGLFVLLAPATATTLAVICIGLWALCTGLMQLVEAPSLREQASSETLMRVSGVLRVLLGALLLVRPRASLMALVWLVAVFAFAEGIVMLGLALGRRRRPLTPQPV